MISANRVTLIQWESVNHGLDVLVSAIAGLKKRDVKVGRVLYLRSSASGPTVDEIRQRAPGVEVEIAVARLPDPTDHSRIYAEVRTILGARSLGANVHVNISPGTPAMHAVWLVLEAGCGLPPGTHLWASQIDKASKTQRIDAVKFDVTSYLSEIRRVQSGRPELPAADPEPNSAARRTALDQVRRFAALPSAPLFILGERGTGKTRLVETYIGPLKQKKVVTVACGQFEGADPRMAESEIFGVARGAFTGANQDRDGLLDAARDGVLFLDEVQDLPRTVQRKLVRLLQDERHAYRRVGDRHEQTANVELVCASNLDEHDLASRLDPDFFDRVALLLVRLPPLRECREDLREDWNRVWRSIRRPAQLPDAAPWSDPIAEALSASNLPGNLRDLQRLALLIMAWWSTGAPGNISAALREWRTAPQRSSTRVPTTMVLDLFEGSRKERVEQFLACQSTEAHDRWGTWPAAAKHLACDEKTLREDQAAARLRSPARSPSR